MQPFFLSFELVIWRSELAAGKLQMGNAAGKFLVA
jgi:hypothetical protein